MTSSTRTRRPAIDEYFEYYDKYIQQVPDGDYFELLSKQTSELEAFLSSITEADAIVLHPPFTWTFKQVIGHLIDVERIFSDRLLRIAAGDEQPQPGMDQDLYVRNSDYDAPSWTALVDELLLCRRANVLLLKRLTPEAWDRRGTASGYSVTVRALAWMMIGHVNHHTTIVRRRIAGTTV